MTSDNETTTEDNALLGKDDKIGRLIAGGFVALLFIVLIMLVVKLGMVLFL